MKRIDWVMEGSSSTVRIFKAVSIGTSKGATSVPDAEQWSLKSKTSQAEHLHFLGIERFSNSDQNAASNRLG